MSIPALWFPQLTPTISEIQVFCALHVLVGACIQVTPVFASEAVVLQMALDALISFIVTPQSPPCPLDVDCSKREYSTSRKCARNTNLVFVASCLSGVAWAVQKLHVLAGFGGRTSCCFGSLSFDVVRHPLDKLVIRLSDGLGTNAIAEHSCNAKVCMILYTTAFFVRCQSPVFWHSECAA